MPLILTLSENDQVVLSNGVIITVTRTGKHIQLEFDAAKDIKIHAIFNDPSEQYKNMQKKRGR